jgi:hypothetical protein
METKKEVRLPEKLSLIQGEFKANKSRFNSFGKYNFRSAEDILEALKPYNTKYGVYFTVSETFEGTSQGGIPILVSCAKIHDVNGLDEIEAKAIVGVDLAQKGMQVPQAFGSASSYGKKYALGNLLLIDDTQDADATNTHGKTGPAKADKIKIDVDNETYKKAVKFIEDGGDLDVIMKKYDVSKEAEKLLKAVKKN